jgi:hypothetical protein
MSFKLNPITGKFDMVGASTSVDSQLKQGVTCLAAVAVGDWVRMNGSTAEKAQADSVANADVIGVVEAKSAATTCTIRLSGISSAIFLGLDNTKDYFLSAATAGAMVNETAVPSGSGNVVISLGKPFSATEFIVNIGQQIVRD